MDRNIVVAFTDEPAEIKELKLLLDLLFSLSVFACSTQLCRKALLTVPSTASGKSTPGFKPRRSIDDRLKIEALQICFWPF
jgi:hypothetical protein